MTNEEAIRRAQQVQLLVDDPIMAEAREHIESECWRLFRELAPTDAEGLAQVKAMQYMHAKYTAFLNRALQDGKLAKFELERARKPGLLERIRG